MPLGAPRAGLMRRPPPGLPELPELPAGFAFVVDAGAYVTDEGDFVIDTLTAQTAQSTSLTLLAQALRSSTATMNILASVEGNGEPWGDDETFPFWDDDTGWIDD